MAFPRPHEAERYMAEALALARKGWGRTEPNPMVGAVVVKRGAIVGRGYHKAAGESHAEVEALKEAGDRARNADLYVNLEPCNHFGRTPPCTHAVIEAGISRVIYGSEDPNPGVEGGGAEALRKAGLAVRGGILVEECSTLNEVFFTHIALRRPFVYLKLAMTLDGRIATRRGKSQWITSEESRNRVHRLRDAVCAVMVGVGTVIADDPALTTRLPRGDGRNPTRIVADSHLKTPLAAEFLNTSAPGKVIIACAANPPARKRMALEAKGATVIPTGDKHRVNLVELCDRLYEAEVTSLLVEGGAELAWGALEARIVDRCLFFYGPMMVGGTKALSGIGGLGVGNLEEAPRLEEVVTSEVGPDVLITGRVAYPQPPADEGPVGTAGN
jgi:diaminohydroxyphosphoribosylaminopyrimidine deaminase / 5-amino-6-(5-phosphoribosylamino)uracil reductase